MEILNILRDPSWQFIGAIAAVFALGATFLVFIFQKSKKLLGFEIISITPLLTTKESFQGKLIIRVKVTFRTVGLQTPSLFVRRLSPSVSA